MKETPGSPREVVAVSIWPTSDRPLRLPRYMTPGASGCDLEAELQEPIELQPGERRLVPTGLAIALPEGFEGQVRPRSGLAVREGLTILNAPGTIDADYRGEICVALVNLGDRPVVIQPGDRIAQLIVARVTRVEWQALPPGSSEDAVQESLQTARGAGGFGHTGVRGAGREGSSSDG